MGLFGRVGGRGRLVGGEERPGFWAAQGAQGQELGGPDKALGLLLQGPDQQGDVGGGAEEPQEPGGVFAQLGGRGEKGLAQGLRMDGQGGLDPLAQAVGLGTAA